MGLLDSDAEELKRNKTSEPTSGRKVNQSGLGALKGLSKYSNLTAKYRTTGKPESDAVPQGVEQSRGTSTKSVQSQGEVGATHSGSNSTTKTEVSAKSVQTQCEVSAAEKVADKNIEQTKSVQSQCETKKNTESKIIDEPKIAESVKVEVSAKSVQSPGNDVVEFVESNDIKDILTKDSINLEVSAKSVQAEAVTKIEETIESFNDLNEGFTKSVQSQCTTELETVELKLNDTIVRAKSVQPAEMVIDNSSIKESFEDKLLEQGSQCKVSATEISNHAILNTDENKSVEKVDVAGLSKSVQSKCKVSATLDELEALPLDFDVSAKSVQSQCDIDSPVNVEEKIEGNSKSVQSECKVSATLDELETLPFDFEVSANPVQSDFKPTENKVSANSVRSDIKSTKTKVSAKSVQSQGEVSAEKLEKSAGETETFANSKSKVIAKNFESSEPTESIISVSGSQRVIVDFLFQLCLWNNSLITPPITKQQLTSETGLLEETALSSIKRLRNKNIIDRHAYKDGKAGWTQYKFAESSYKELLHLREVGAKSVQLRFPSEVEKSVAATIAVDKKGPLAENNQGKQASAEIGWFKNLDFSKVHPISAMVVNPAIRSLVEEKLSPEFVQDFINRFTSWTSTQGRITSPIGLFCDKLKELAREGDSAIFSCMTEEERQLEAAFAAQVEKAKAEMELIQKARSEKAEKETDSNFEKWYSAATDDEKFSLAKPSSFAPADSEAYRRLLKAAYLQRKSAAE
ncbi:MAG: hypothetical protein ACXVCR_09900 [Bdellovibrio sp.]